MIPGPAGSTKPKRYRPRLSTRIKSWFRSKWVLRSVYELELSLRDDEITNYESTIASLYRSVERLELHLAKQAELNGKTRRQFFDLTEKLHAVSDDSRGKAEQLAQLLKFILWREQQEKEQYGSVLFEYPINLAIERPQQTITLMTTDGLKAAMYDATDSPVPVAVQEATFRYEKFFILFSKKDPYRILLPSHGPWDSIKLPYEVEESNVRDKIRAGLDS